MKIGIDISQIVYQTGVSRYTFELVQKLLTIDPKNHYFLYAGSLRQRQLLNAFILKIKNLKTTSRLTYLSPKLADLFWNRLNLLAPDKNQHLDVFHASNWALPKTKCPLVTTIHDLTFLKYPRSHLPYYIKAHTRHLKRARKFADIVITDAFSTKKDLIEFGIPQEKIKVIHLAPADIFKPVKDQKLIQSVLDKYQLRPSFILSVGTQEPRKNTKRLVKAYLSLKTSTQLVLVGKFGWGEKTKPVNGVKVLGFVPDEDLKTLYSAAKVFIYPSLYEGFGLPILEAFSCGCPVVTSNVSSLPELGGDAAVYINNPKSVSQIALAIKQVLKTNHADYQSLVKKSLNQAERFSWTKTAQETLKIYQQVTK